MAGHARNGAKPCTPAIPGIPPTTGEVGAERALISQWPLNAKRAISKEQEMSQLNAVVAVYATHVEAEEAVKELQRAGIDMGTLSIVGKDSHTDEHVVGYYNTGDRMKYWGKTGAFWGGFWGLLLGSAFFAIPGIGPVLVAGPLVAWIVGALEGAVLFGGLSAIGAGLYGMGIPRDSVIEYETALKTDKFLLMVHGSVPQVEKAKNILESTRPVHVSLHVPELVAVSAR
jgi:uncharacterized membrane protein